MRQLRALFPIPCPIPCVLWAALVLWQSPAVAAPVQRPAKLSVSIELPGLLPGTYYYGYSRPSLVARGSTSISVDSMARVIGVPAGAMTLSQPLVVPVTATTAVASLTATALSNSSGLFSVGGAGGFPGEAPCPPAGAGVGGIACVPQNGFGGAMAVLGGLKIHIIPDVVVIPLDWQAGRVGLYGPGSGDFTTEAAPFTVGTASVRFSTSSGTTATNRQGAIGASSFRLVAPTMVSALGNRLPIFAALEVEFTDGLGTPGFVGDVPEASATLMLATGVLGLLWLARPRLPRD